MNDPCTEQRGLTLPGHLYVHVPLCRAKCAYCDFYSLAPRDPAESGRVVEALVGQAGRWTRRGLPVTPLETLYVGGGTPTVLGAALPGLIDGVVARFGLAPDAEVTVEANPESLDARQARALAASGVTRISLGVQSFDDDELLMLGRCHDARQAEGAAALVLDAGLRLSVDLMCGLPGQRMPAWTASVRRALELGAGHLSVYPLSLEPGTSLTAAVEQGRLPEPDADAAAEMMAVAGELAQGYGLARYEVASHARAGERSRHNTAYWTGRPYLGVGPSAHGMLDGGQARALGLPIEADAARVRFSVPASLSRGLSRTPSLEVETLTAGAAQREDAMLGMRLTDGVSAELAAAAGVLHVMRSLAADGLVEMADSRWRPTQRGWLLGNEVFGRIWNAEPPADGAG